MKNSKGPNNMKNRKGSSDGDVVGCIVLLMLLMGAIIVFFPIIFTFLSFIIRWWSGLLF